MAGRAVPRRPRRRESDVRRPEPAAPVRRRAAVGAALATAGLLAALPVPARPALEDDVLAVTRELICYCGCSTQTVAECTCGTADGIRERVAGQLREGRTPAQVLDLWVAERGEQVLAVPRASGFNLVGWTMPFVAVLAALTTLTLVLVRRRPVVAATAGGEAADPTPSDTESASWLARVEADLRRRDP